MGDGLLLKAPLWFFEDRRHRFFVCLISHPFRTFPENFVPRSSRVSSPGMVVTLPPKKIVMQQQLQFLSNKLETFRIS